MLHVKRNRHRVCRHGPGSRGGATPAPAVPDITMHNRSPVITRLNRRLRIAATVIVSLAGLIGLAFLATYYYLKPTLPDVAVLRDVRLQVPLASISRDGRLLAQIGDQRRVPVTWDEIPPVVVQAVLAAEDDRFFQHPGVDWQGIVRAVLVAATTMQATRRAAAR